MRSTKNLGTVASRMVRLLGLLSVVLLATAQAPAFAADGASRSADPAIGERAALVRDMLMGSVQLVADRAGGARRTGSAVILAVDAETDRTLLLTAAHVLSPLVEQELRALTALQREAGAVTVLAVDDAVDLALVEVEGLAATGIQLEPVTMVPHAMLGDDILVVSFPWGRRATLVSGMVSQIVWDETIRSSELPLGGSVALIDASVSHGMSGGGVFHRASGALVGIVRGYRSVRVTLPGEETPAVTLPVAGETTVVPTMTILCFLQANGRSQQMAFPLQPVLQRLDCAALDRPS